MIYAASNKRCHNWKLETKSSASLNNTGRNALRDEGDHAFQVLQFWLSKAVSLGS